MKKTPPNLYLMNTKCRTATGIVKIFYMGILCVTLKEKYKTVCAEFAFTKVTFDR
jgi:hypothetical protein